jgi:hypothetical protein
VATQTLAECGAKGAQLKQISLIDFHPSVTRAYWNAEFECDNQNDGRCHVWIDAESGRPVDIKFGNAFDTKPQEKLPIEQCEAFGWQIVRKYGILRDLRLAHLQRYGNSIIMQVRACVNGLPILNKMDWHGYELSFNPVTKTISSFENHEQYPKVDQRPVTVTKYQALEAIKKMAEESKDYKMYKERFAGKEFIGYRINIERGYFVEDRKFPARQVWSANVVVTRRSEVLKTTNSGGCRLMIDAVTGEKVELNDSEAY